MVNTRHVVDVFKIQLGLQGYVSYRFTVTLKEMGDYFVVHTTSPSGHTTGCIMLDGTNNEENASSIVERPRLQS